jgi:hypothetical protein
LRDVVSSFMTSGGVSFTDALDAELSCAEQFQAIYEAAGSEGCGDDIMFVKYEDMVANRAETTARIFGFLGLPPLSEVDTSALDLLFRVHGTSATPQQSIGRWRHDLTAEQRAACGGLDSFLELFGYEPPAPRATLGSQAITHHPPA